MCSSDLILNNKSNKNEGLSLEEFFTDFLQTTYYGTTGITNDDIQNTRKKIIKKEPNIAIEIYFSNGNFIFIIKIKSCTG